MPSTIRNLSERRVPQVLAIYLGAAFGVVQFVDFVGSRYLLPAVWTDLALLAMAVLLPSVLLYTYHHGRPGRDEWQRSEKIFIPINLLVLISLVTVIGAGTPLSATGQRITLTDEQGNTREAVVPSKAYRKRVAMFMFDTPADSATRWLRFGMPQMAWQDLLQQNFVEVLPPIYLREGLTRKGFAAGVDVPLSLKRDVVAELHVPHFVTGRVEKSGDEFVATVQVYETETSRLIKERTYRHRDAAQLADQVSAGLVEDLGIPVLADGQADMPVAEILSKHPTALRAYVDASAAMQIDNDFARAAASSAAAVQQDPTFAAAHLLQYAVAMLSNQPELALSAVQKAMDHSYRMPERVQEFIKVDYYMVRQDYQRAFAVLDMLAQMYPEDITVQQQLMQINAARDDKDAIIATAKKILELDPTRSELMLTLAQTYEQKGDAKAALAQYETYAKKYPKEARGYRHTGDMHRLVGAHAQARAAYERALLIEPNDVQTLIALATLDWQTGAFDAAAQKLQEASSSAKSPEDRVRTLQALASLHEYRGDIRTSIKHSETALHESAKFQPAAIVLLANIQLPGDWARVDGKVAMQKLNELRQQLKAPFDMYLPLAEMNVYSELEDAAGVQRAADALDALMKKQDFKWLASPIAHGRGRAAELRGDCTDAIVQYREMGKARPLEVSTSRYVGRCLRKLGKHREAIGELNRALAVAPAHGDANLQLGLVYLDAGDKVNARKYLERALQTWEGADPQFKPAKEAKAALARI